MAMDFGRAVSDAVVWLSAEIRKTLEDDDKAFASSGLPRASATVCYGDEEWKTAEEKGRDGRSEEKRVFASRRQRAAAPASSVSLDCLVCWQDALEASPLLLDGGFAAPTPSTRGESPNETLGACVADETGCGASSAFPRAQTASSKPTLTSACPLSPSSASFASAGAGDFCDRDGGPRSPFPVDVALNQRLYLHYGDPCALKVDALVCFTSEAYRPIDALGARLELIGGDELASEVRHLERCKAGEARICRSFNLPSSHIVYTVGPRCNSKYLTATHNALNGCIRESLLLLEEKSLSTVALPFFVPSVSKKSASPSPVAACASPAYPPGSPPSLRATGLEPRGLQRVRSAEGAQAESESGAEQKKPDALGGDERAAYIHTTLRSLRRWMERLRSKVDAVVLFANDIQEMRMCDSFVRLYFPRNPTEEAEARWGLPEEIGNEFGQIEVAERRIRIARDGPQKAGSFSESSDGSFASFPSRKGEITAQFGGLFMRASDDESDQEDTARTKPGESEDRRVILGSTDVSFTDAKASTETEKRIQALNANYDVRGDLDSETLYHRYLRQASAIADCVAFQQLDKIGFLYPCGTDKAGRPVIVFLAALFPSTPLDAGLVLLYIVKKLDPYIRDKYTLLYVNTEVHHSHMPSMALWREFFHLFSKYENTLDELLVLHPGLLFKAAFACSWPYLPTHLWSGTSYLQTVQELFEHVEEKQVRLPNYVLEFDRKPRKRILGLSL
ncbi:macro domain-containing protein [Besnoitia besnoiti]|uniref:Macro domain-containing protein n=1 Tax=Besnoitia besnoiti TaxID=94643 RepID=A0A2A9MCM8_BESBE|nr:macro domain-containing protein [Besnoitia besnoiti]PFH33686.1 macro domain-containing protein [Besnoitia besnoiti]